MATIQTMLSFHDATRLEVNNTLNCAEKWFLLEMEKLNPYVQKKILKCTKHLEPSGIECTHILNPVCG